jgi:hypothetical protein
VRVTVAYRSSTLVNRRVQVIIAFMCSSVSHFL